jgi:PhnB protein
MPDRALEEQLNQAIDAMLAGAALQTSGLELDTLVRIAGALREMPAEDFKSRLKTELQRSASMTPAPAAPVREGFRTITPYIVVPDGAKLIEFMKHTFKAEELYHVTSPGGFHAEVRIGDSILMIGGGDAIRGRERIGAFHVYVPDCDAACRRAVEAGATSMGEPADRPYGERAGFVKDFAGNYWYIATRFEGPVYLEGLGTVVPFLHPVKARVFIDFLKTAFGAEEMAVHEQSGRVMHAAVRIGDAVLEMGEAPEHQLPSRFFLYVEDCDAWYRRAVAAGATSVEEPADRPYGHRTATVLDPFGHEWVPASLLKNP